MQNNSLSDEQCRAIYEAMNQLSWDDNEFEAGLPMSEDSIVKGISLIRAAANAFEPEEVTLWPILIQCADKLFEGKKFPRNVGESDFDYLQRAIRSAPTSFERLSTFVRPEGLHYETGILVARFAEAMAAKLLAAQEKYGFSDGWMQPDWMDECRAKLAEHVAKGDPRDVAAYCAFLWHHGEPTA